MTRKNNSYVDDLFTVTSADIPIIGNESFQFSRLYNVKGISVPEAYVITTISFDDFLISTNTTEIILNLLSSVEPFIRKSAREASGQIVNMIMTYEIPKAIFTSLEEIFRSMAGKGNKAYVQLEVSQVIEEKFIPEKSRNISFYDISSLDEFIHNIRLIWASLFSTEAIEVRTNSYYRGPITVAILVRQMRKFELSGKVYSIPPITHETNTIQVNANYGILNDSLDIQSFQDEYKVDLDSMTIIEKNIVPQDYMIIRTGSKDNSDIKTVPVEISNEWRRKQKINDDIILYLVEKSKQLENFFLEPLEVTWGMEMGELFITDVEVLRKPTEKNLDIEKEYLKKFEVKEVSDQSIDKDDFPETLEKIEQEINLLIQKDNVYISENRKEKEINIEETEVKNNREVSWPKWSEKYKLTGDVMLDISNVNAKNIHLLSLFNGTYFDSTEILLSKKVLPEEIFRTEKRIKNWIDAMANDIAAAATNTDQGAFIYQFSNPGISDFKSINTDKKYSEFYGDERFIQFPESLSSEYLAISEVKESFNVPNIHYCIPHIRSSDNLEDIIKILKSIGFRNSKNGKLYAEVALPSFAYDILDINKGIIDGVIINYDTLLRISVYRSKPREVDHKILAKLVSEVVRMCRKSNLDCLIRFSDENDLALKLVTPMKPDGFIFSRIPTNEQMKFLAEYDMAVLNKKS